MEGSCACYFTLKWRGQFGSRPDSSKFPWFVFVPCKSVTVTWMPGPPLLIMQTTRDDHISYLCTIWYRDQSDEIFSRVGWVKETTNRIEKEQNFKILTIECARWHSKSSVFNCYLPLSQIRSMAGEKLFKKQANISPRSFPKSENSSRSTKLEASLSSKIFKLKSLTNEWTKWFPNLAPAQVVCL